MAKKKKGQVKSWSGEATVSLTVSAYDIPAVNIRQAEAIFHGLIHNGLLESARVRLWKHKYGYESYGKGKPDIDLKFPLMLEGFDETEIDLELNEE